MYHTQYKNSSASTQSRGFTWATVYAQHVMLGRISLDTTVLVCLLELYLEALLEDQSLIWAES